MSTSTAQRLSAEERREEVLAVARDLFAEHGFQGTSTEEIARRAGISHPYLFRLFGTKKKLFLANVKRCQAETLTMFQDASAGLEGEEALEAIGKAYRDAIASDPLRLKAQMQMYAACADAQVRKEVRRGYGRLVEYVERVSGAPPERVTAFFATGMLLNVVVSMQLLDASEPWAKRLMTGLGK
jgi:AcrR family transcriptional regulator